MTAPVSPARPRNRAPIAIAIVVMALGLLLGLGTFAVTLNPSSLVWGALVIIAGLVLLGFALIERGPRR